MGAVSFIRFLFAVLISFFAAFAALLMLSFVVMQCSQPLQMIFPCVTAAMLIGAWFCGIFGARVQSEHPKIFPLLTYAAYLLLILLVSFFLSGDEISWTSRLILVAAGALCAFLGSLLRKGEKRGAAASFSNIRRAKKRMYRKT